MKRSLVAASACIILGGVGCGTPVIYNFQATPRNFCQTPQTIGVEWSHAGGIGSIAAAPATTEFPSPTTVNATGRVDTQVSGSTTFTLRVAGRTTAERRVVASRVEGTATFAIGGLAECRGGQFVRSVEVFEDDYVREVVVQRLSTAGAEPLEVQGPGGRADIPPLGSTEVLSGSRLVGVWTLRATPRTPCTEPDGVRPGDTALLSLSAEIGCP